MSSKMEASPRSRLCGRIAGFMHSLWPSRWMSGVHPHKGPLRTDSLSRGPRLIWFEAYALRRWAEDGCSDPVNRRLLRWLWLLTRKSNSFSIKGSYFEAHHEELIRPRFCCTGRRCDPHADDCGCRTWRKEHRLWCLSARHSVGQLRSARPPRVALHSGKLQEVQRAKERQVSPKAAPQSADT